MVELNDKMIARILADFEKGYRVFVHKTTGEKLSFPNPQKHPAYTINMEDWKTELQILNQNRPDFEEIQDWSEGVVFEIMEEFAEQIYDNRALKGELLVALSHSNPLSRFKYVIDDSGNYAQRWEAYKQRRQVELIYKFWEDK